MTYAAFLLGINVGPHKRVAMPALNKMCGPELTTRNWNTIQKMVL
ncbi:MAG: DUF1697 domain-containing protein [Candidatus Kerfeldbacteria bacterium]|nr:DUF1697 domain-containing protein [Candidatus Kerfeldbacteria bacterium]